MKIKNEIEPVQVFAGTMWEAGIVKSLLENAEIEVYIINEILGIKNPWISTSNEADLVKLIVSNSDEGKAKIIVEEYENNRKTNEF
jgi:hypothetical protein